VYKLGLGLAIWSKGAATLLPSINPMPPIVRSGGERFLLLPGRLPLFYYSVSIGTYARSVYGLFKLEEIYMVNPDNTFSLELRQYSASSTRYKNRTLLSVLLQFPFPRSSYKHIKTTISQGSFSHEFFHSKPSFNYQRWALSKSWAILFTILSFNIQGLLAISGVLAQATGREISHTATSTMKDRARVYTTHRQHKKPHRGRPLSAYVYPGVMSSDVDNFSESRSQS